MGLARTIRQLAGVALAAALALTACGSDPDAGSPEDTDTTATAAAQGDATEADAAATSEVVIEHYQGETTVPVKPETVVVFDLGVLDTLTELGIDVAGVPALELTDLPERFERYNGDAYAKVGSLFEPDYEAVNALEPDLIIVGGRSSEVYPDLSELAPTIDLTVWGEGHVDQAKTMIRTLGPIFDVEDEIEARLAALDAAIERTTARAADAGTGLAVMTSAGEVSAYGPGSRFGLVHDEFGLPPVAEDLEAATHGDAISFEFILEADPAHLFVLDRDSAVGEDGAAAAQVLDNELVRQTTAWQNDDVHYLDAVAWYLAPNGLGSLETMVAEVEAALS